MKYKIYKKILFTFYLLLDTIIIYGHNLQSYCTLEGLLLHGIPGKCLVLIENFPYKGYQDKRLTQQNISIFNNPEIDDIVRKNIIAQGQ